MAARAGAAPIWGTQALPGGSAAGGGGAGPRRLLSAAALRLGPPPCSPVPYSSPSPHFLFFLAVWIQTLDLVIYWLCDLE